MNGFSSGAANTSSCRSVPSAAARSTTWSATRTPTRGAVPGVENTAYGRLSGPNPLPSGISMVVMHAPFPGWLEQSQRDELVDRFGDAARAEGGEPRPRRPQSLGSQVPDPGGHDGAVALGQRGD